jgi:SAM-dependent methyltransferase
MDKSVYLRQLKNNNGHWWFESRKSIIKNFLKNKIKKKIDILDFGCGVGINLEMLATFGNVFYYDRNKKVQNLNNKIKRFSKFKCIKNIKKIKKKFGLIVALDVIEHIDQDSQAINYLSTLLTKNGKILITVPAYQFLFSIKDEILHHKRRYIKKNLNKMLSRKFDIIKSSYFNFFLSPIIISTTLLLKFFKKNYIDSVEKKPTFVLNFILKFVFTFEKFLLNNINFPFGISILVFAKKK